jgi:hypothetical protein
VCAPDVGWKYHPKHVEQFPDINKLCNVASCWIYIGILLGAHPILHISRIRIKFLSTQFAAAFWYNYSPQETLIFLIIRDHTYTCKAADKIIVVKIVQV